MNNWMMFNLQDPMNEMMENIYLFHDLNLMNLIFITSMISLIFMYMIFNKFNNRFLTQGHTIEIIWTIMPIMILIILAIPSLKILYFTDETISPSLSIKVIGHQWYWSYEYPEFKFQFDSFMNKIFYLNNFRLLDTDYNLLIPINTEIRLIITSQDVIHSWTIPSLGIKMDAIPGRINQTPMKSMYNKK
uniref:Cytochrome c oxidase subunit 2 n=1 Tax=Cleptes metallicorpus TaxID=2491147 RepID=A0A3Q8U9X4_9HYME|nr:cytochrome c oxidase subunit 2 [Cleptes metallicorpus]